MEQQPEDGKEDVVLCGHTKLGCQIGARLAHKGRLQKNAVQLQVGRQVDGWVVRYLDKGVAETLADALDGDLGVAVVVAIVVAYSYLHNKEFDDGVSIAK